MYLFFYHIYCWVQKHKFIAVCISFIFLLTFGFLASKIRFEEDITQMIPKNEKSGLTTKVMQQMNFSDKISVLIEKKVGHSIDDAIALAQQFIDTLQLDTTYINGIQGQIDQDNIGDVYDFVLQNIPLLLEVKDYDSLTVKIQPTAIEAKIEENYHALMMPSSFVIAPFIQKDPLAFAALGLQKLQQVGVGDSFILYDGFVVSKDSTKVLLFLSPTYQGAEIAENKRLASYLYGLQAQFNTEFKDRASLSYFGSALVAVANADQIKSDILKTILISMSVLMLLLVLFYRKWYIPLLVFIPTVFAGVFALGCLYLYKPVISAVSLSIGAVLIGITIDFALHILTHFKKNGDVQDVYKELTKPLIMSGTTNAVVFLCLLFVHSEALVDLGVFAFITLVSSAVFTLLIIPHLYQAKEELKENSWLDKLASYPFERSKVLIGICLLLIVVSLFTSNRVFFNNDLAKLNFMPEVLQTVEEKLDALTNTSAKSLYVVATGTTLDEALELNEQIASTLDSELKQGMILHFSNVNSLVNPLATQKDKINRWRTFWIQHSPTVVEQRIRLEGDKYGFEEDAHNDFYRLLKKDFKPITIADYDRLPNIGILDYIAYQDGLYTVSSLVKLKESKRTAFVQQMELIKGVIVIDRKQLNETFLGGLRDDFNTLVGYSSVAVLLILWFFFRRIELVLLAAAPIALTGLVTAGLMGLFEIEFNIFSAIVCTLVFGHGVDFSIFMTAALQKQYTTGRDELQTYRTSILLAVLTTVLAIGALIFAKHPALISISTVSLMGIFAAVIITFVFYPLLFRFFITNRARQGKSPFTLGILVMSVLLFTYYGLGSLILSFVARIIFLLLPKAKEKHLRFRSLIAKFMKSVLYCYPMVKNKTGNPYDETFEKPAVVIGNHSSFLDTLTMGMLVPKMIFLVNDWVWKSPIFGRAVRALGFYPVSSGIEGSMETLKEKVKEGYSIVVFPEGTRSTDNVIHRFHKGAFYLAEQLQLDVVPIYIHGNGDVLPKGDIMIFPGRLSPVIGKRIQYEDMTFGKNYGQRTKLISQYFKKEYDQWRLQLEDENYFVKKIELAYLYKDDAILQGIKANLKRRKHAFWELNKCLTTLDLKITHISDSYGELDYLLSLQQGRRKVIGVIADNEKREVAESIYWSMNRTIRFSALIELSPVMVVSSTLDIIVLQNMPWASIDKVIAVGNVNDLEFLRTLGYTQTAFGEQLKIYIRNDRNT